MKRLFIICVCILLTVPSFSKVLEHSTRTDWMRTGEEKLNARRTNTTYYFKIVKISAEELDAARNQRVNQLGVSIGTRNQLSGKALTEIENVKGDNPSSKETFKLAKRLGVILAILMVLDVFIPTADTITKMIVAQNVTYERVETATDVAQTVYEDIMDLFAEGKGEQQAG